MRHLFSLIISFFLSPLNWMVILVIFQFFVKRQRLKKITRWLAAGIFLLFSNQWIFDSYARHWQTPLRDISKDSTYSCAILLGGYCSVDEFNQEGFFTYGADRFIQAAKLYKSGKVRHIFISGGTTKTSKGYFKVGEWTKKELETLGIPDEAISYEDQSDNTAENALYTKKALASTNFNPPYLLITSAHHMPRASLIFTNVGLQTIPFPCNYVAGTEKFHLSELIPNPGTLRDWDPFLKETAAYLLYKIKGKN